MPSPRAPGLDPIGSLALVLVVGFILYGSIYPFEFAVPPGPAGPLRHLLGTWRNWDHRGDLVANIAFYMPLGFTLVRATSRLPLAVAVIVATLCGSLLSFAVEFTQFYCPSRDSTLGDVYANAIGSNVGALLAAAIGLRTWPLPRLRDLHWPAVILIAAWLGSRLYPYVPEIDFHRYLNGVRTIANAPIVSPLDLARLTIAWLAVGVLAEVLAGPRAGLALFALVVLAEWGGKLSIITHGLNAAEVAGALLALPLLLAFRRFPAAGPAVLAAGFVPLIVAQDLAGSATPRLPLLCTAVFLAGTLIWLLGRARVPTWPATIAAATLIAVAHPSQYAATVTTLVIGGVFFALGRREGRQPGPSASRGSGRQMMRAPSRKG